MLNTLIELTAWLGGGIWDTLSDNAVTAVLRNKVQKRLLSTFFQDNWSIGRVTKEVWEA